jgi:putative FmdB family regulatory protein
VPTYEYACQSCGTHVEVFQRFSEPSLTECSVCGGPLRKVFHPAGILFKGSGFYVTDSRAGAAASDGDASKRGEGAKPPAEGAAAASDAGSKKETGSKADPGSSSTPASKTPPKPKEKSA